jgi:uncharacterized protein (TIGR03083 family)
MERTTYLDTIRDRAAAAARAARLSTDAPVPSCPGWSVADLIRHLGGVYGWCSSIVQSGSRTDYVAGPADLSGSALVDWFEAQARLVVATLTDADPDKDVWTFGLPRTVRFWLRRQALETAMHCWDAQSAVGPADPFDSELATDGIDEFLDMMLPRVLRLLPGTWTGQTIHLHRTDGDGEWLVRLGPDGAVDVERSHGKGDVAVRGPASDLLLWMINRASAGSLEVFGDGTLIDRWAAEIRF